MHRIPAINPSIGRRLSIGCELLVDKSCPCGVAWRDVRRPRTAMAPARSGRVAAAAAAAADPLPLPPHHYRNTVALLPRYRRPTAVRAAAAVVPCCGDAMVLAWLCHVIAA